MDALILPAPRGVYPVLPRPMADQGGREHRIALPGRTEHC